jgi:DNA-binding XRE family transcriptional regulator
MTLRECMDKHRITRDEIATIAGVSKSMVYHVLAGRRMFHPKTAENLIRYFGGDLTFEDLYSQDK